jgi:hypothetical protein
MRNQLILQCQQLTGSPRRSLRRYRQQARSLAQSRARHRRSDSPGLGRRHRAALPLALPGPATRVTESITD